MIRWFGFCGHQWFLMSTFHLFADTNSAVIFIIRWPRLQRFYRQNESCDWLREYKTRHRVGIQIRRTVESISKRFFTEVVSEAICYYRFTASSNWSEQI